MGDIGLIIGLFATFVLGIIGLFKHFDNRMDNIQNKISENQKATAQQREKLNYTEKTLDRFEGALDKFQEEFKKVAIEVYQMGGSSKKSTGNPISLEEKENLIKKMKKGTIEEGEAKKLKRVLEEEKRVAENKGDTVETIAIGLLLAALAYLLYKLISEEG